MPSSRCTRNGIVVSLGSPFQRLLPRGDASRQHGDPVDIGVDVLCRILNMIERDRVGLQFDVPAARLVVEDHRQQQNRAGRGTDVDTQLLRECPQDPESRDHPLSAARPLR